MSPDPILDALVKDGAGVFQLEPEANSQEQFEKVILPLLDSGSPLCSQVAALLEKFRTLQIPCDLIMTLRSVLSNQGVENFAQAISMFDSLASSFGTSTGRKKLTALQEIKMLSVTSCNSSFWEPLP